MAEQTEGTIEIDAKPADVLGVIADFEAYPDWSDVKSVEVAERDAKGRGKEVAYEVSMMGVTAGYTLAYRYGKNRVSWTTSRAEGAVRDVQGEYVLEEEDGGTLVTYRLSVELAVPLPGFVRRQGEKKVIRTALDGLKRRVEEG